MGPVRLLLSGLPLYTICTPGVFFFFFFFFFSVDVASASGVTVAVTTQLCRKLKQEARMMCHSLCSCSITILLFLLLRRLVGSYLILNLKFLGDIYIYFFLNS